MKKKEGVVLKKEGNVQKVAGLAEQSPDMGKLREHDKEGGKWVEEMKGRSKGNKGREISGVGGGGDKYAVAEWREDKSRVAQRVENFLKGA